MLDYPFVRHALIALLTGAVMMLISRWMRRAKPHTDEGDRGRIAPNRIISAAMALLCLGFGAVAMWAWIMIPDSGIAAGLVGIFFLAGGAVMSTSLLPVYDIEWTEDGITGPTTLWFPPIGPARGTMFWEDIEAVGKDLGGNWFAQDTKGRRIRWNFVYTGFPALMVRIEEECPWLFDEAHPA